MVAMLSWLFGDNLSVVNNSTVMPSGKLQKRSHLLNCNMCREAQASRIINFAHIDGKDNPADVLTGQFCWIHPFQTKTRAHVD